jgi:hypothetical protein
LSSAVLACRACEPIDPSEKLKGPNRLGPSKTNLGRNRLGGRAGPIMTQPN